MQDPRATGSPSPTPPTPKPYAQTSAKGAQKPCGVTTERCPSHDKKAWERTPSDATHPQSARRLTKLTPPIDKQPGAAPDARKSLTTSRLPTNKMSAGCCDTDSPWLSWSYWFEPLYTRARKRTIEEQEMIEACTTPRHGRSSFDE